MAFGKEIGGFKYSRPGEMLDGLKNFEGKPDKDIIDLPAIALNNGPMRSVTAVINRSTQKILVEISQALDECPQPILDEKAILKPLSLANPMGDQEKRGLSPMEIYRENEEKWKETVTPTQLLTEEYRQATLRTISDGRGVSKKAMEKLSPKDMDICTSENSYSITETWKNLRTKLEELFIENRDMDKSVERGWRDVVSGNPLKTEMKNKIKEQLLEPLKEYIASEPSIPEETRGKLASQLDKIEQNHFTAKCRG